MFGRQRQDTLLACGAHPARSVGRGMVMDNKSRESFEERSRALFQDSVEGLDYALRSRLTQARNAAIEAAAAKRRPWFTRLGVLAPAGVTAAAVLGTVLWLGSPL